MYINRADCNQLRNLSPIDEADRERVELSLSGKPRRGTPFWSQVVSLIPDRSIRVSDEKLKVLLAPMTTIWKTVLTLCAACAMLACSSSPSSRETASAPAKPEPPKQSDVGSGRIAFQRLYTTSRGWAGDTEPVSLESQNYKHAGGNPEAPLGHDGKSAIWRGTFASSSRQSMKTYMWSGLTGPDAPSPGITPGTEDSWSTTNKSTQPFQLVYLKFDTDQALETAQKHGGVALLKKDPDLPVNYRLSWEGRRSMLVWHVVYGKSTNEPDLDVVVDATTNQFVRVEK